MEAVGARFVSELRSNCSVTISTCEKAIAGCQEVVEVLVEKLKQTVIASTKEKLSDTELQCLLETFDQESRPLDFIGQIGSRSRIFGRKRRS